MTEDTEKTSRQTRKAPVQYKILNTFLPMGVVRKTLFDTFNMYQREEDLSNSPLVQWGLRTLKRGAWWYGCEKKPPEAWEDCVLKRQDRVLQLYLNIKSDGYNGSTISIFFDDDGTIKTYDGFHRLFIMDYLGMKEMINCVITPRKGDFPLVETIISVNNGKNLYQPCVDERLKDFTVWRKDSRRRLSFILKNIKGSTVLDIGCSEGYFSRELTKRGHQVTALDVGGKRLAVARYLSIINNLKLDYHCGRWQDYIEGKFFESVLYLSVFHHDVLNLGVDEAFKELEKFRGRAKQIFFESPIASSDVSWLNKERRHLYHFTEDEFKAKIEEATEMKVTKTWYGIRPLFLLVA